MPVGLLWDLARRGKNWHISDDLNVDPIDALAIAARDSVRAFDSAISIGLVVPDWLKQAQQQRLLDSLSGTGVKWYLLWRPIAAATYWIQHFFKGIRLDYPSRTPIGRIVCLHLGLFECELTIVELVADPFEDEVLVLPARQRPVASRANVRLVVSQA